MTAGDGPRDPSGFWSSRVSLRRGSLNTQLAGLAAAAIEASGGQVDVATMRDFDAPSYNQDAQRDEGFPPGQTSSGGGWRHVTRSWWPHRRTTPRCRARCRTPSTEFPGTIRSRSTSGTGS